MNPAAQNLNQAIPNRILSLLSPIGRAAYFPKTGILGQSAQAKECPINATIGIALEEDGSPMCLEAIAEQCDISVSELVPYAPSYGVIELRRYWHQRLCQASPLLSPDAISLPVVTCALTHALSVAGKLLLAPGSLLVLPDLFWGNYRLIFEQGCGVKIKTFETFSSGGFNVEGCLDAIRRSPEGPLTLLLNFPNNPTGYNCTEKEAIELREGLADLAEARGGLSVIIDDAYFGLTYDDKSIQQSMFAYLSDAHTSLLAVKIDGATKEDYVWGFRVGFVTFGYQGASSTALTALEDKCAGLVRGSISNAPRLSQQLLLNAYRHPNFARQKMEKYTILKTRFETMLATFDGVFNFHKRFELLPVNAGYFLCLRPLNIDAEVLRSQLVTHYGVGVISTSGLIRIAFSSVPTEKIANLVESLVKAYDELVGDVS